MECLCSNFDTAKKFDRDMLKYSLEYIFLQTKSLNVDSKNVGKKQPFPGFVYGRCSYKFGNIHVETR